MAIFRPSAIVGAISGNVGGVNFCNPSGSAVIRKAKTRTSPRSTDQLIASSTFASIAQTWRTLSLEKKKTWRTAALSQNFTNRLGVQRKLSGFQYFMWANAVGVVLDPPTTNVTPAPPTLVFSSSVSLGVKLSITAVTVFDENIGMIQAMPLYKDVPFSSVPFLRNMDWLIIPGSTIIDFTARYEQVFAPVVLGQSIAMRWRTISDKHFTGQEHSQVVVTTA